MTESAPGIEISAFDWMPAFGHGLVRDLRVRWLLEEIGLPYATRLYSRFDASGPVAGFTTDDHPFHQVPAFAQGEVRMFESGAICLYLAESSEKLLPREEKARAETLSWSFAALSSIEPFVLHHQMIAVFDRDQPGAADYAPVAEKRLRTRLSLLSDALGGKDWLTGDFSVADILMVHVLAPPSVRSGGLQDNLAAYVERGQARPAYQRALAAQIADFQDRENAT